MSLSQKLQIPSGSAIRVIAKPADLELDLPNVTFGDQLDGDFDAVLVFALDMSTLKDFAAPALRLAREDKLAWIAYPKAKQLQTDLNRDILATFAADSGAQPVRQISIDDVWSALRFRPL